MNNSFAQASISREERENFSPLTLPFEDALTRWVACLPGVDATQVKHDLLRLGYLYRSGGHYQVYRRYEKLFVERLEDRFLDVDIFPTEQGRARLIDLCSRGHLTAKDGAASSSTMMAEAT